MNTRIERFVREGRIVGSVKHLSEVPDTDTSMPEAMSTFYRGNPLDASRLFFAGMRSDNYAFFGYKDPMDGLVVWAGCRVLTVEEARRHWNRGERIQEHREAIELIAKIEAWNAGVPVPEKAACEVAVYDKADVEEFLGPVLHLIFRNWISLGKGRNDVEHKRVSK